MHPSNDDRTCTCIQQHRPASHRSHMVHAAGSNGTCPNQSAGLHAHPAGATADVCARTRSRVRARARTHTHARTNVPFVICVYTQCVDKDNTNPEFDGSSLAITGGGDAEDPDVPTRVNTTHAHAAHTHTQHARRIPQTNTHANARARPLVLLQACSPSLSHSLPLDATTCTRTNVHTHARRTHTHTCHTIAHIWTHIQTHTYTHTHTHGRAHTTRRHNILPHLVLQDPGDNCEHLRTASFRVVLAKPLVRSPMQDRTVAWSAFVRVVTEIAKSCHDWLAGIEDNTPGSTRVRSKAQRIAVRTIHVRERTIPPLWTHPENSRRLASRRVRRTTRPPLVLVRAHPPGRDPNKNTHHLHERARACARASTCTRVRHASVR